MKHTIRNVLRDDRLRYFTGDFEKGHGQDGPAPTTLRPDKNLEKIPVTFFQLELLGDVLAKAVDLAGNVRELIRRHLVDPVEPVAVQEVGVGAPRKDGLVLGVVIREVVLGRRMGNPL